MNSQAIYTSSSFGTRKTNPPLDNRWAEKMRWWWRAEKYRRQEDCGGVRFIYDTLCTGDTAFDIGAHKGGYMYHLLQAAGKRGRVVAFEPQSLLYNYLERIKAGFRLANLSVEHAAVSNQCGMAALGIPFNGRQTSSPCASILTSPPYPELQTIESVQTLMIDAYCEKNNIYPAFLKIDVEGHELEVFKGARHLLTTHKPKLLFECELRFAGDDKMKETFELLLQYGYRGFFVHGKQTRPLGEFSPAVHQSGKGRNYCNNFIFV